MGKNVIPDRQNGNTNFFKIYLKNLLRHGSALLYSPFRLARKGADSITCGTDN
jgi:hypothetical protein